MVLIVGYEEVKPKVHYTLTVNVADTKLVTCSSGEENPHKILITARELITKGLMPVITAYSEYHSKYDGIQREEAIITPETLEKIVAGTFNYPAKTFPLLYDNIYGADIGD